MVGRTPEGYRYQPVRFVDHLKVRVKTVSVVEDPPSPPERKIVLRPTKGTRLTEEERERVRELHHQGVRRDEIATALRRSVRSIDTVLASQSHCKDGQEGGGFT